MTTLFDHHSDLDRLQRIHWYPVTIYRDVSYVGIAGGNRLFWCNYIDSYVLNYLRDKDLEFIITYDDAGNRGVSRTILLWVFRNPSDARWCAYFFRSRRYHYFPEGCFADRDREQEFSFWDEVYLAVHGLPMPDGTPDWEYQLGDLSVGSTGNCPMWQEGPRARPLSRPRR